MSVSLEIQADLVGPKVVCLAHGAGSHLNHPTMLMLADFVRAAGWSVVRFNFPYRTQGKGIPDRMPNLVEAYREAVRLCRESGPKRLVIGGHSMGGRVASMLLAEESVADGGLFFGYPLHPPGQFEKLRDAHLPPIKVPVLQINGTQDEFCNFDLMNEVQTRLSPSYQTHWVEGADHSYRVKRASGRTSAQARAEIEDTVGSWLASV